MFKNYLKITFRSLMKNKLFVVINVLGLGIALSCTVVAFLSWSFNDKYDVQHVNAANIYRINFERITNGELIKNGITPQPLGAAIRENITEIDEVIRLSPNDGNFKIGDELFRTSVYAVDPAILEVFTFPLHEFQIVAVAPRDGVVVDVDGHSLCLLILHVDWYAPTVMRTRVAERAFKLQ